MKKTFIHYIKLTFALVLLVSAGNVSGQTITVTGGSAYANVPAFYFSATCGDVTGAVAGSDALVNNAPITVASDVFVTSMSFIMGSVGYGDASSFDALGITNEVVSIPPSCASMLSVSGNVLTGTGGNYSMARVTVSSVTPFKQVQIAKSSYVNSDIFLVLGTIQVTAVCNAGTTAPVPTVTTKANVCPAATVSLPSTNAGPAGTTVKWFTNNAHTGTAVADPAQAPAGTYYAFYYDATNNCYSPASAAVTATVTLCPVNITNTCPASSVDLANSLASSNSIPSGYTLTYHSGTPATDANKLTTSVVTTAGTYYGAYFLPGQQCYSATGRPLVVTFTDCCAAKIAPDLTN